jgi:hypothetical protein
MFAVTASASRRASMVSRNSLVTVFHWMELTSMSLSAAKMGNRMRPAC